LTSPRSGAANATPTCDAAGVCGFACVPGFLACNGQCVPNDVANCGACGLACPGAANATLTCAGGVCGCDGNPANGCETNLAIDVNNCGACGNVCPLPPNAISTCGGGVCGFLCGPGFVACGGQCVDTASDRFNCGACGNVCLGIGTCQGGVCV
jgi:hypothetical protein